MSQRTKNRTKRIKTPGTLSIYMLFLIMATVGALLFIRNFTIKNPPGDSTEVNIVKPGPKTEKPRLQLYTFRYTTIPPQNDEGGDKSGNKDGQGSGKQCPRESKKENCECPPDEEVWPFCNEPLDSCHERKGLKVKPPNSSKQYCFYDPNNPDTKAIAEKKMKDPNCELFCLGKPVIYLYPTEPTLVDVEIVTPGRIYISDPLYPQKGWENVLAHPDGKLVYQGNVYHELYYETAVDKVRQPANGIILAASQLQPQLTKITTKLGLNKLEQQEFLDYWLPRLHDLHSPYILFSLLETNEKERIDHVNISPKPDTFIAFLAYFKPLPLPYANIEPLVLPQTPPQRIGFTAVEWGGTIDKN